jgi:hypothetical protein
LKESSNSLSAESIARVIKESNKGDASSVAVINTARKLTGRSNFDLYQEEDFKKDVAKALKGYDFVNSILRNIPNKADKVLTSSGSAFNNYESPLTSETLKVAQKYAKISVPVTGSAPFKASDNIPEPDTHSTHVAKSLKQFNEIAYVLLEDKNCGSDRLDCYEVKESCYYALADRLYDLYNGGNVDYMNIDLMGEYQYEQISKDADLPRLEKGRPEHEVNECIRAKKKQAEEGIKRVVKAADVMEDVDAEAIKYNKEGLDKVVGKIEQRRKGEVLDDNKKKEMDDWFIYAKKEMEAKDSEIERLKEKLQEYESKGEAGALGGDHKTINMQEDERMDL